MAVRSVATTDTINTFRTTFNTLGTDVGDLTTLNTTDKTSIVAALNETLSNTSSFFLRDSTSSVQELVTGDTLNVVGATNEITATVSGTDTLTIGLADSISGITSISATTLTDGTATISGGTINASIINENGTRVATKPFAIAQAIALG